MRREYDEDGAHNPRRNVVLMHLLRVWSGARLDAATNGCPPVLKNLEHCIEFIVSRKESNVKAVNRFIKILDKLLPSVEMISLLRVYSTYDVAFVQPHRFLTNKAHELHLDSVGQDCDNEWMGTASMPSLALQMLFLKP